MEDGFPSNKHPVTHLLSRLRGGDDSAEEQLLDLVYAELQGLARAVFSNQNRGHTLQPTALVHEAWIKLAGNLGSVTDRQHFFVLAGMAMRQVIANHARGKQADKRGGGARRVTLDTSLEGQPGSELGLVDLDDSLSRLAEHSERLARVAELRLLSGLSIEEAASAMGVSRRTIDGDWALARAWLSRELDGRG